MPITPTPWATKTRPFTPRSTKPSTSSPKTATRPTNSSAGCIAAGELNLKVMALLDEANTGAYGHPEPTQVRVTPVRGKAIVVSGHDLKDLEELLKQTEGRGVNVYTHGEMLPCHAYPGLEEIQAPGGQLRRRLAGPGPTSSTPSPAPS